MANKKIKRPAKILAVLFAVILLAGAYFLVTRPWEKVGDPGESESIDLTEMSSTLVYSYVYDMIYNRPEDYLGKAVKARGPHTVFYYDKTGLYYHSILIKDATACCAQGLEFSFKGEYPPVDTEIEITGIFSNYEELGIIYYYLDVFEMKVLS